LTIGGKCYQHFLVSSKFERKTKTGIDKFCLLLWRIRHYGTPGKSEGTRDKEGGWVLEAFSAGAKIEIAVLVFFLVLSFDRKSIRIFAARRRS